MTTEPPFLPPAVESSPLQGLTDSLPTDKGRTRILAVDDSPLDLQLLEDQLADEGYIVHTARDGEEALAKVAAEPPDLILLDVIMPKLDGYEVCRRLKSDGRTILIPVVMITSLQATHERIKGIEAGADEFLSKPFNRQELMTRVRSLMKLKRHTDELESAETVLFTLALSVEAKDPYTEGHCDRLARYSVALGRTLSLSPEYLKALHRGGILHDVGKIGIPDAILLKPGPLTDPERIAIQTHPVIGERICSPLKSLRLVLPIIRHHHERWDGSGYPDGLAGDAIPLTARILQVVDLYDAFTTERPYKPAYSREQAFATMREETAKGWWDARLVEAFIALITEEWMKK
ncbi:MAG TPA: HD domain-containing phosphohydrolase [Candidatus Methylomirabilis sp.]|nr:HD domain-containing phosphohydrolase [Candidatus Methylomirabilis sp.]